MDVKTGSVVLQIQIELALSSGYRLSVQLVD